MKKSTNQSSLLLVIFFLSLCFVAPSAKSQKSKTPNILIAISDDQSFQHTSFAGCNFVKTPAFDRVASEGIYFANCMAGSPGCAPSRSTLVTGRFHWQNKEAGQHGSHWIKEVVPMVDEFRAAGYETGTTGKGVGPFRYGEPYRIENAAGNADNSKSYSGSDQPVAKGISKTNYYANFEHFITIRDEDKPFYFWFGAKEPHRSFEKGSWKRMGKKLSDVKVPGFLPDDPEIRGDLLDYAVEVEWFDAHLMKMLKLLEKKGELENTIVIVTSDNGMAFPRAKANCFEYGVHVPLAIRFPAGSVTKREVTDVVSFADIAPTLFELCQIEPENMLPVFGKSFTNILQSNKSGQVDKDKEYVFAGRERHSSSRYLNHGYPQRAVRDKQFLYIWNIRSERWPAGAPQRLKEKGGTECYPMWGIDENGKHNSEWAFTDVDAAPSKSFIVENKEEYPEFFSWSYDKRPEFELYDIQKDPYCLKNLLGIKEYKKEQRRLHKALMAKLVETEDPRVVGKGNEKEIFDTYPRHMKLRYFPVPK